MRTIFKYKGSVNESYAPGQALPGINGNIGLSGNNGNSIYFSSFDLDNSYYIELALQKIENNYILSNDSTIQLTDRPYILNDIILTNTGNCYKLIKSTNNLYSFDIEFLGKIKYNLSNIIKRIIIYDITNLTIVDENDNELLTNNKYSYLQKIPIVNSRCEKNIYNNISEEDFNIYGTWFKIIVQLNENYAGNNIDDLYEINLITYIKTQKTYYLNKFPGINLSYNNTISLSKKLEFNDIKECNINDEFGYTKFFHEILNDDIYGYPYFPYVKTTYLSDYELDKYCLLNNGISCTLNNNRSFWYQTGVAASTVKQNNINLNIPNTIEKNNNNEQIYTSDLNIKKSIINQNKNIIEEICAETSLIDSSYYIFENGIPDTSLTNEPNFCEACFDYYENNTQSFLELNNFPKYSIDGVLTNMNENDIQGAINNYKSNLINCETETLNNRAGDSAYFSKLDSSLVSNEIYNFISNTNNEFFIYLRNKKTRELIISPIVVEFNNEFKDKKIKVQIESNKIKILN